MIPIKVKLLSIKEGLTEYDDVMMIKIVSKKYNIVIMKDYIPVIGEINGSVEIGLKDKTVTLEELKGYYMHKQNQFNLFIKDK